MSQRADRGFEIFDFDSRRLLTSGRNQMPPFQAFPATIILTETAPNTFGNAGFNTLRGPGS